jgi:hypothetical protein
MVNAMHGQSQVTVARTVAGFLLLAHVVGLLFYGPKLSGLWVVNGALVVSTLSVFCFLPRSWLRRIRVLAVALASAAICATLVMAYGDITLVNGADHGALVLRALVIGILVVMIVEATSQSAKP